MFLVKAGTTSFRGYWVRIVDATTGAPYTGATSATSGAAFGYTRPGSTRTSISLSDLAAVDSAYSSGGIKHIAAGWYRLDLPDAALATGVDDVLIDGTFTSYVVISPRLQLTGFDPRTDAVATVAGMLDANVKGWNGTAVASPHTAGYPVVTIKDGTGTGEIDTNAGAVVSVTTVATTTTLTNAPSDSSGVTTLLSRLTSTRAGYLDNLSAGAVALQSTLTTVAGYIDTEVATIITNIAALPAAVWDRLTTALTTSGSIGAWILANAGSGASPATFWTYETRTLTQGASSVVAAVTGSNVTVYRGTRWSITLTGLTDMTGQTGVWFGVKANPREDADTASICLVKTTTGLIAFDGDDTITAGHAAITVNSTTSITITVEADATQYATPGAYEYAVKALNASGKPFMVSSGGTFNIVSDIPMAIS